MHPWVRMILAFWNADTVFFAMAPIILFNDSGILNTNTIVFTMIQARMSLDTDVFMMIPLYVQ